MKTSNVFASRSVITAVVAGAVAIGGIYYIMQQQAPKLSTEEMNVQEPRKETSTGSTAAKPVTSTSKPAPTETPAAPAPASFQGTIFADTRVSYAFKYPAKYKVTVYDFGINDDELCLVMSTSQGPTACSYNFRTTPTSKLSAKKVVDEMIEKNDVYVAQAKVDGQPLAHKYRAEDTTVAGTNATMIIDTPRTGSEILVKIVLEKNGGTYVFNSGAALNSASHQELNNILSTVQFIQ